jgi:glycosyltransferase involved in cell wall biosynthesis
VVPLRAARGACARRVDAVLSETAPLFSAVVPTLGDESKLLPLLDALSRQTISRERFEVLISFDGAEPSDAVRDRLRGLGARAIVLPARRGPGAARNAGAREARGRWLAFTEDDCVPAADWLARAAERIERDAALQGLEGETVTPNGRPVRRRDGVEPTYIPTNLFVARALFERMGGYCEQYFDAGSGIYFREDSDFGFTLERAGAIVRVEPSARVVHPEEHPALLDPIRWARRYEMDPLLERRHPDRFRDGIEVARLGPFLIRRPFVRTCWAVLLAFGAALGSALLREDGLAAFWLAVAAIALVALWAKWRFHPLRLPVLPFVPFVLLAALARGRRRAARLAGAASPASKPTVAPPNGQG